MSNPLIEKNRHWLGVYSSLARLAGWVLIAFGVFGLVSGSYFILFDQSAIQFRSRIFNEAIVGSIYRMIFPGLFVLMIAQFLQYLIDRDYRPGWLLRHGDKVLYLNVAMYIIQIFRTLQAPSQFLVRFEDAHQYIMFFSSTTVPRLLKLMVVIFILLGLATALRRMTPIIDESKTLV